MSLYTRSGDDGSTGLFGGGRVSKCHPRVEAYGTVDELNATLGLAVTVIDDRTHLGAELCSMFARLQSRLFDLGADLATPLESPHEDRISRITSRHVAAIEQFIDRIDGENTPLKSFVLPGGSELAARLHVSRAVCRRAERRVLSLNAEEPINPEVPVYLNRVSDLLFAVARRANLEAGVPDVPWIPHPGTGG
ncbi:MAG: cob(I)yrinic acid a,c-diamide adenosyltransferase [Planctomycetota bacterium]|jgi:cob(I)alamin adenosyltransferase